MNSYPPGAGAIGLLLFACPDTCPFCDGAATPHCNRNQSGQQPKFCLMRTRLNAVHCRRARNTPLDSTVESCIYFFAPVRPVGVSSNGRTPVSDTVNLGSSPSTPANKVPCPVQGFLFLSLRRRSPAAINYLENRFVGVRLSQKSSETSPAPHPDGSSISRLPGQERRAGTIRSEQRTISSIATGRGLAQKNNCCKQDDLDCPHPGALRLPKNCRPDTDRRPTHQPQPSDRMRCGRAVKRPLTVW